MKTKIQLIGHTITLDAKEIYMESDCAETGSSCSIKGKVVVSNREALPPCNQNQLYFCLCGNGAGANPSGCAVFLVSLRTGEFALKKRNEVVDVLKTELLPDSAKLQLSQIRPVGALDLKNHEPKYSGFTYYLDYCPKCDGQQEKELQQSETQTAPAAKLHDLLHTKWEDLHLIHHEIENEPSTIVELDESTLTDAGKEAWADVMNADVLRIYTGYYGLQMELAGVKASRLDAFSSMLAGYCSVQDYEKWVNEPDDQPSQTPEMKL